MNVETITVLPQEAQAKLLAYKRLSDRQRTKEDEILEHAYTMLRKGAKVLDVSVAIRSAGPNADGYPRLALAPSDWPTVRCSRTGGAAITFLHENWRHRRGAYRVDDFPQTRSNWYDVHSPVPHVPAEIRPKIALSNFHTLFEVEKWTVYPKDPILLRRIPRTSLFIVVAEWELTELEASILAAAP